MRSIGGAFGSLIRLQLGLSWSRVGVQMGSSWGPEYLKIISNFLVILEAERVFSLVLPKTFVVGTYQKMKSIAKN